MANENKQFYVVGSKQDPRQNGILRARDAGGETVVGPFNTGTEEGGSWYNANFAGSYFE
ncbi:Uncharacterised protein [uncultured archaeon]|nr:Uncharacterised protein [uncultured archaeon]